MTRTVKDLTGGSEINFASVGEHSLKGLDERYELFKPLVEINM
jgi:hypothetical protein